MSNEHYTELRNTIREWQSQEWHLKKWKKQPALVSKSGKEIQFYYGQDFAPETFDLIENAWEHDHCEFCWITISDCVHNKCIQEAYESDDGWICPDCYEHLIINQEDPETYLGH